MKERLDLVLVARGLSESREKAQRLIMAGKVFVNGQRMDKAGAPVADTAQVELRGELPYVSRGGHKLASALDRFTIDVSGRVCADVGASTGGFTDVILQRGAAKVYAIDVGYGQLDWKLRSNPRVVVMDRTNIRDVASLPEPAQFVSIDVSFISLRLVLPVVRQLLTMDADVVALVKPQFEAGRGKVGKGGVVRDSAVHRAVLIEMLEYCANNGWLVRALMASPLKGAAGNLEFPLHLQIAGPGLPKGIPHQALVEAALAEAREV
jgi:23S rRNA (cytidine1920-2'-O)/16S rRNA (cytidine1409-2'-O)-methyltransferase